MFIQKYKYINHVESVLLLNKNYLSRNPKMSNMTSTEKKVTLHCEKSSLFTVNKSFVGYGKINIKLSQTRLI